MTRRRAHLRREEILRSAADVVAQQGIARTRVADVAAALGVSTGLVFYHFETKERLLSEAFLAAAAGDLARLDAAVGRSGSATGRLRAVLRLYAPTGDAPGWTLDIDAWAEALRTPEIRAASRDLHRRWRDGLEQVLRAGAESKEFRLISPSGAAEVAERIAAMLDGLAVATQVRGSIPRARAHRWACEYAAALLGIEVEALIRPRRRASS